jgi:hypothetical protein
MEGGSAPGGGGAAARQGAHEQTDIAAAKETLFEQVRLFARQCEVIVSIFLTWFALVRLMRMCARREQAQVAKLTKENAALRLQLAQQAATLQRDADKRVGVVYGFFIICAAANHWHLSTPGACMPASLSLHTIALAECARQESPC